MKKILKFLPAVFAAVALVVATSLSWLAIENPVNFPDSFGGSTRVSYFAGGDGSKKDPYLITTRTHMYNLAWLQYLGYFNLGGYINNGRAQSFFKLAFDGAGLDMEGLALPPIGTKEYPFIGNFDGNGKVVYNFIVSNTKNTAKSTDYNLKVYPRGARFDDNGVLTTTGTVTDNSTRAQVDIIGMFGVAGDLTLNASGDSFVTSYYTKSDLNKHKYGEDGKTLIPIPETNADGTAFNTAANDFYYSGMKISGFYIDRVKVNSESAKSLVGILAGYICSSVQNTGVYRSKISVAAETSGGVIGLFDSTNNQRSYDTVVSKYSLVGDYDEKLVGWSEDPSGDGGNNENEDDFGNSIDMRTLNRRLGYIHHAFGTYGGSIVSKYNTANLHLNLYCTTAGFYWGATDAKGDYRYRGLNIRNGTILPLKVDKKQAGLDIKVEDEVANTHSGRNYPTNNYYLDKKTAYANDSTNFELETVSDSNTGYIVGGGTDSATEANAIYMVSRVQPLMSKNGTSYPYGIYKAFNYSSPVEYSGTNYPKYNEHENSFGMLTIDLDGKQYLIRDSKNKNVYTDISVVNAIYGNGTISGIKESKEFKEYNDRTGKKGVRTNFDNRMNDTSVVHGFHFYNKINRSSYTTVSAKAKILGIDYDSYKFIKGGINFTVSNPGHITAILGTYYYATDQSIRQSLFNLFKVERKKNETTGALEILSFKQINEIYTDNSGNVYYKYKGETGSTAEGVDVNTLTKKFDFPQLSESATLLADTAYYFEIPVKAGDYVIGSATTSNNQGAYLMYLDIGADGDDGSGGSGETQTLPYLMESVDFVSMSATDTSDTLSVPSGGYPSYNDVGFKLGGDGASAINDEVFFKREKHSADVTGDINTTVYYWRQNINLVCALVPSDSPLGAEDETKASW